MRPWAVRTIGILVVLGIVLSIVLRSAFPIVLAICLGGVLAAAELRTRS
jgi:hypothetical protein